MAIKDPIADLYTRIRNALNIRHDYVEVPSSNLKLEIVRILKDEGFIESFSLINQDLVKKVIRIILKYRPNGKPLIANISRVSRSSKRQYVKKSNIPKVRNGFGIVIVSTSKGVLSGKEARIKNVGGELLGQVY
tara:strand:- start:123 stop:524 length:402 start_codon:yes stop_codon:yes gene_type:complete